MPLHVPAMAPSSRPRLPRHPHPLDLAGPRPPLLQPRRAARFRRMLQKEMQQGKHQKASRKATGRCACQICTGCCIMFASPASRMLDSTLE